jgi:hypothetical protein
MASAIEIDTLRGVLGGSVWFHLDLTNDVLYLRNVTTRAERVFGEGTPSGFTLLRTDSGEIAGMTVINFWSRFGTGRLASASIRAVKQQ